MFALLAALVFFVGVAVVVFGNIASLSTAVAVVLFGGLGFWALHVAFPIRLSR